MRNTKNHPQDHIQTHYSALPWHAPAFAQPSEHTQERIEDINAKLETISSIQRIF
jgi:hypothetical protein